MKPTKYVRLDQESIRKDFPEVFAKYEATHMITAIPGTQVSIAKLKANESVCYGDGKSFHFKLTKLPSNMDVFEEFKENVRQMLIHFNKSSLTLGTVTLEENIVKFCSYKHDVLRYLKDNEQ